MESFYFIILAIAVVILILVLAVIGWMMTQNVNVQAFPGITNTCPDYWTITSDGKCTRPDAGNRNRGNEDTTTIKFSDTPGVSGTTFDPTNSGWGTDICKKKKWAQTFGVNWDTVTNSNTAC
jgi:hypothetical protein